ncbi:MAG TPA: helix-turn-helix domain-containing protein [Rhizomicrobium sp.]|jgi:cytoskeleton protein RodZ|nr:helix-turn-helix domain-containing protein [Rhizomicrobium sp.]
MAKVTLLPPGKRGEAGRQQVRMQDDLADSTAQTVGQYFRAVRLSRGEEIATVARALRIRSDQVAAIEESRLDDLPGRTYAIGFVRSYAQHLGLAPAEFVDRFKAEIGGPAEQFPLKGLPPDAGEGGLPYSWLLMALIVLGVVGYAGYHLVRSANLPSVQPVAPVPAVMSPDSEKHGSPVKRPVHGQPRPNIASPSSVPAASASGPQPIAVTPPASGTPANSALAALPQGQVYGIQNRNARVVIHARAATHVLVQGLGAKVFINRILHPGDAYRVPDLVGLSLTTPDGGAVLLELDGQFAGVAGRAGQLTEALSLDPQAIVDRAHRANPG